MAAINMRGQRVGRWLVMERAPTIKKNAFWRCKCDCGTIRDLCAHNLRRGMTMSCGCLVREHGVGKTTKYSRTHTASGRVGGNVRLDCYSADQETRQSWLERMALVGRLITWKHSVRYASYT